MGVSTILYSLNKDNQTITIKCGKCSNHYETHYDKNKTVEFIPEFDSYENFKADACPNCGVLEVFNFNLPYEELNEDFFNSLDDEMPEDEKTQRRFLKELMSEFKFDEK